MSNERELLSSFFNKIWKDKPGYAYIALKSPSGDEWQQKFFEWPMDLESIVQTVLTQRTYNEVYFAPALFRVASSKKEDVLGSFCFWVEFDGDLPAEFGDLPKPSIVVQTSTETHQHLYWCVDNFLDAEEIDMGNKYLSYTLGADMSGWDASQVLRPPQTLNHKKQRQALLVASSENTVDSVAFLENLAKIDLPKKYEPPTEIPYLPDVLRKYAFPTDVWNLFVNGVEQDRSAGLMRLGYFLAEISLTDPEMYSVLLDADGRWGKFSRRNDQAFRLSEIITIARIKYPFKIKLGAIEQGIIAVGHESLLQKNTQIEWLIDGLFQQGGYLLLTGHTGVGKSQLSLNLATNSVLGKEFLGRATAESRKVLFVSLEMGTVELQYIRNLQAQELSNAERAVLEERLFFYDVGYPMYFNRQENKQMLEEYIEKEEPNLIIFDSLGSMTEQELSKETDAKNLMDWNDFLRAQYGISTLIIHHHRKAQSGNKRPNTISDIYGSHYFTSRATSVIILWADRHGVIELNPAKLRLSRPQKPFPIKRGEDLNFSISSKGAIFQDDVFVAEEVDVTDKTIASPKEYDFGAGI